MSESTARQYVKEKAIIIAVIKAIKSLVLIFSILIPPKIFYFDVNIIQKNFFVNVFEDTSKKQIEEPKRTVPIGSLVKKLCKKYPQKATICDYFFPQKKPKFWAKKNDKK